MAYFEFIWTDKLVEHIDQHGISPDLRRQAIDAEAEMRQAMMREPTVSGQLRSAVAESGIDHRELAAQAGLSPKTLAEFLVGKASLDSKVIDKLAAVLKHELKPIG